MKKNNKNIIAMVTLVLFVTPTELFAQTTNRLANPFGRLGTLNDLIRILIEIVRLVVFPFLVVAVIYAGFLIVTAQGDEKKLSLGKSVLIWTLVGAAIIIGAQVIADAVGGTVTPFLDAVR